MIDGPAATRWRRCFFIASPFKGNESQMRWVCHAISAGDEPPPDALDLDLRNHSVVVVAIVRWLISAGVFRRRRDGRGLSRLQRVLLAVLVRGKVPALGPGDVVVSKMNRPVVISALLGQLFRVTNVHLGTSKRIPDRFIAVKIASPAFPAVSADIRLDVAPGPFRDALEPPAIADASPVWSLMLGGTATGFDYRLRDWSALVDWLRQINAALGVRWLVTSSPRTPPEALAAFRELERTAPEVVLEAVWYGPRTENPTTRFLARSAVAVVTEDSASMVSDAVNAGLPVLTFGPRRRAPNPLVDGLLEHHAALPTVARFSPDSLPDANAVAHHLARLRPPSQCWSTSFRDQWERLFADG